MRQLWRVCKWGGLILLAALAAVLSLNVFDEKPTATTAALLQQNGVELSRQQNLYYPLMGFYAAAGVDMEGAGWSWVQAMNQAWREGRSIRLAERDAEPARYSFIGDKNQLPGRQEPPDLPGLVALLKKSGTAIMRPVNDNPVLLDRYLALRRYPHFAVTVPANFMMVGEPQWEGVTLARGLWKLELADLLLRDQAGEVSKRLEQDVAFWRRQIAESRIDTVSKMLMNSILMNDFQLASQVLGLDPRQAQNAALHTLSLPLTREELSMTGPLKREFAEEQRYMLVLSRGQAELSEIEETEGFHWDQLEWRLQRLFFLPQATANVMASRMQSVIDADAQPCMRYPSREKAKGSSLLARLRNPVGKDMIDMLQPNPYIFYTGRMCQLVGFQRLLALQLELRRRAVPDAQIGDFVRNAGSEFADPFTGGPMQWLPDRHALSFKAQDKRGKEALPWPI